MTEIYAYWLSKYNQQLYVIFDAGNGRYGINFRQRISGLLPVENRYFPAADYRKICSQLNDGTITFEMIGK